MIRNFKTEIEKTECHTLVAACLSELYLAEERGLSDPKDIPTATYYENTIDEFFRKHLSESEVEGAGNESEE